jgi:hypothetical protein
MQFTTVIKKFAEKGEKTGWTYIDITNDMAEAINPGVKTAFRVKGSLAGVAFSGVSLYPMGAGHFIMAIKADLRKSTGIVVGQQVVVHMVYDAQPYQVEADLLACLADEPAAQAYFDSLPQGHRHYFSKWVEAAKTDATRTKRIAMAVNALGKGMGYGEMIRMHKAMAS